MYLDLSNKACVFSVTFHFDRLLMLFHQDIFSVLFPFCDHSGRMRTNSIFNYQFVNMPGPAQQAGVPHSAGTRAMGLEACHIVGADHPGTETARCC